MPSMEMEKSRGGGKGGAGEEGRGEGGRRRREGVGEEGKLFWFLLGMGWRGKITLVFEFAILRGLQDIQVEMFGGGQL